MLHVLWPPQSLALQKAWSRRLWEVCSIHRPAACHAGGERQPLLSAGGRVSYSMLLNAQESVHRRAGRPASLGWALGLWRASLFRGLLDDSRGRRLCLSAATPARVWAGRSPGSLGPGVRPASQNRGADPALRLLFWSLATP